MNVHSGWRWVLIGVAANVVLGASNLRAATVIVPDDNPSLVQAAANAGPGDVVQVRPGVYAEGKPIVIRQSGVQIVGLGGRPVITGGNGRGGFWVRGASDVIIGGVEVRGKGKAVRLDDCTACGVVDVVFTECGLGVRVRGGSGNVIVGSVFNDVWRDEGVFVDSSPFGFVVGNSMSLVHGRGIRIQGSAGTQVFDNSVQGANRGFWILRSDGSQLERNTAPANLHEGFRITSSDDLRMSENVASDNGDAGFRVTSSDRAVLEGNTASANDGAGFHLRGDETVVSGNTAASNGDSGFDVAGHTLDIQGNGATGNAGYGFDVSSADPDLTVADLLAAANTASGNQVDFKVD